jgi:flagellin
MSNQVRGKSQANPNAQDANNLLATAESGLSDITDILSKMRELSVQAATDTLNDNDRSSIDLEFQSLKDELTRIANVTEYNGMNVLNGSYQGQFKTGSTSGETWDGDGPRSLFNANSNYSNPGVLDGYNQYQPGSPPFIQYSDPHGTEGPRAINENGPPDNIRGHWRLQIGADNDINNQHEFSLMNATAKGLDLNRTDHHQNWHSFNFEQFKHAIKDGNPGWDERLQGDVYIDGSTGEISFEPENTDGLVEVTWDHDANSSAGTLDGGSGALVAGARVITDIGTNADPDGVGPMEKVWVVSDALGEGSSSYSGTIHTSMSDDNRYWNGAYDEWSEDYDTNVGSVDAARDAVTRLDHAIDEINRERSYVGSEQNKLQFTMSNLTSNIQSIESSRSSIEDVDFAAEAADLAKNQILAQSGTAMLAQASAISQNILGLLA